MDGIPILCDLRAQLIEAGAVNTRTQLAGSAGIIDQVLPIQSFGLGLYLIFDLQNVAIPAGEGPEVWDGEPRFLSLSHAPGQQLPPCPAVPESPQGEIIAPGNIRLGLRVDVDNNIREAERAKRDIINNPKQGRLLALWFYNKVKSQGDWDYKWWDGEALRAGRRSRYEPFGNFVFGAAGVAAGFNEDQLLRLAGYFQTDPTNARGEAPNIVFSFLGIGGTAPYGDEPEDAENIKRGIEYYRRKFVLKDCQ